MIDFQKYADLVQEDARFIRHVLMWGTYLEFLSVIMFWGAAPEYKPLQEVWRNAWFYICPALICGVAVHAIAVIFYDIDTPLSPKSRIWRIFPLVDGTDWMTLINNASAELDRFHGRITRTYHFSHANISTVVEAVLDERATFQYRPRASARYADSWRTVRLTFDFKDMMTHQRIEDTDFPRLRPRDKVRVIHTLQVLNRVVYCEALSAPFASIQAALHRTREFAAENGINLEEAEPPMSVEITSLPNSNTWRYKFSPVSTNRGWLVFHVRWLSVDGEVMPLQGQPHEFVESLLRQNISVLTRDLHVETLVVDYQEIAPQLTLMRIEQREEGCTQWLGCVNNASARHSSILTDYRVACAGIDFSTLTGALRRKFYIKLAETIESLDGDGIAKVDMALRLTQDNAPVPVVFLSYLHGEERFAILMAYDSSQEAWLSAHNSGLPNVPISCDNFEAWLSQEQAEIGSTNLLRQLHAICATRVANNEWAATAEENMSLSRILIEAFDYIQMPKNTRKFFEQTGRMAVPRRQRMLQIS